MYFGLQFAKLQPRFIKLKMLFELNVWNVILSNQCTASCPIENMTFAAHVTRHGTPRVIIALIDEEICSTIATKSGLDI